MILLAYEILKELKAWIWAQDSYRESDQWTLSGLRRKVGSGALYLPSVVVGGLLDCIFITVWVGFPRPKFLWNKPEYKCYVPPASLSRLKSSCSEKMFPLLPKSISANSRGELKLPHVSHQAKERKIKILIPCSMRMNSKILATDLWLSSYRKLLCLLPEPIESQCSLYPGKISTSARKKIITEERTFEQWMASF